MAPIAIGPTKRRTAVKLTDFKPDYPPEVCERRFNEALRRACGKPATYNLEDDESDPIVLEWRKCQENLGR